MAPSAGTCYSFHRLFLSFYSSFKTLYGDSSQINPRVFPMHLIFMAARTFHGELNAHSIGNGNFITVLIFLKKRSWRTSLLVVVHRMASKMLWENATEEMFSMPPIWAFSGLLVGHYEKKECWVRRAFNLVHKCVPRRIKISEDNDIFLCALHSLHLTMFLIIRQPT